MSECSIFLSDLCRGSLVAMLHLTMAAVLMGCTAVSKESGLPKSL